MLCYPTGWLMQSQALFGSISHLQLCLQAVEPAVFPLFTWPLATELG